MEPQEQKRLFTPEQWDNAMLNERNARPDSSSRPPGALRSAADYQKAL